MAGLFKISAIVLDNRAQGVSTGTFSLDAGSCVVSQKFRLFNERIVQSRKVF